MRIIFLAVAFFAVIVAAVYTPMIATLGIIALTVALLFIASYFSHAVVLLAFLYPFLGIVLDFSFFRSTQTVPYLGGVNAPLADIVGLLILLVWIGMVVVRIWQGMRTPGSLRKELTTMRFPMVGAASVFWFSAVLSLMHVPLLWVWSSVKYIARPIVFFYVVFVVVVVNALRTERMIRAAFWAMWSAGIVAALFGFASLFVVPAEGFVRATVFAIGGIAPFGTNHNLLAETLVVTAPLGLALVAWNTRRSARVWIVAGSVLQIIIALLTFARTAWIVLTVQACIWALSVGKHAATHIVRRLKPVLVLFIPLVIVMGFVSFSEVVQSSTMTRADMARIALFYWQKAPIVGQGVGTYMPSLWTIKAFTRDYGEPLEAHGVVWKLLFEQGLFGLISFGVLVGGCLHHAVRAWRRVYWASGRAIMTATVMMMSGAVVYQLFNTMYYSAKLWLPMGVGLAASYLYGSDKHSV